MHRPRSAVVLAIFATALLAPLRCAAQQDAPLLTLLPRETAPMPSVRIELELELRADGTALPTMSAPPEPQRVRAARLVPEDRTWLRAIIAGAITFVVGYALPVAWGSAEVTNAAALRYVPFAGAFVAAAQTDDELERAGSILAAIAQLAGIATLIGGLCTLPGDSTDGEDGPYVALDVGPGSLHLHGRF